MRVRCIAEEPNADQVILLGSQFQPGRTVYPVTAGEEYAVLGLGVWDGVLWIEIEMQAEVVVSVPLFLFAIVDGKPSRLWEGRLHADGAFTLWPPSFYQETYHDRLSDGKPEEVRDFRSIKERMLVEEMSEIM